MTTALIVLTIVAAATYIIGAVIWAGYWLLEWSDSYLGADRSEAARNVLMTPLWPLPILQIALEAFAELRDDAKENR